VVWCVGRIVYARGYFADPRRRDLGFTIGAVATVALFAAPLVAAAMALAHAATAPTP
jgi:glutathione S-transferase